MRTASVATAPHGFAPWVHVELQFVLLAPKHDVRREACGSGFHHAVAEGREIQALEHRLASCEQDRRKRKVQFILGRNMFGPVRGEWLDDNWKGWCSGQWCDRRLPLVQHRLRRGPNTAVRTEVRQRGR